MKKVLILYFITFNTEPDENRGSSASKVIDLRKLKGFTNTKKIKRRYDIMTYFE